MAEQNRQHERDHRNGRTYDTREFERWSRDDDERDERSRGGGDRDRWSLSDRDRSFGRGSREMQNAGGQDRGEYASSGRHGQGYEPWRDDDARGSGGWSGRGEGDYGQDQRRGQRFGGGSSSQGYRGGEEFGGSSQGYRSSEVFGGGSQGYRGGQGFGGGNQSYRGGEGFGGGIQSYRKGQGFGGGSQTDERFGRGGENFGRTGDYSSGVGRQSHAGKVPRIISARTSASRNRCPTGSLMMTRSTPARSPFR